jgi:hypothetical protein
MFVRFFENDMATGEAVRKLFQLRCVLADVGLEGFGAVQAVKADL